MTIAITSVMIEAAARKLAYLQGVGADGRWERLGEHKRDRYRSEAYQVLRAGLEAA
jgi:hypothetical protein